MYVNFQLKNLLLFRPFLPPFLHQNLPVEEGRRAGPKRPPRAKSDPHFSMHFRPFLHHFSKHFSSRFSIRFSNPALLPCKFFGDVFCSSVSPPVSLPVSPRNMEVFFVTLSFYPSLLILRPPSFGKLPYIYIYIYTSEDA